MEKKHQSSNLHKAVEHDDEVLSENLSEEAVCELTIFYDNLDAFQDTEDVNEESKRSLSEALKHPNPRRMSTLGLSETAPRNVTLNFDKLSCDIESISPASLRSIISKLKPTLYDFDLYLYG